MKTQNIIALLLISSAFSSVSIAAGSDSCSVVFNANRLSSSEVIDRLATATNELAERADEELKILMNDSQIWTAGEKQKLTEIQSIVSKHSLNWSTFRDANKWVLKGEKSDQLRELIASLDIIKGLSQQKIDLIVLNVANYRSGDIAKNYSSIFFSPIHMLAFQIDNLKFDRSDKIENEKLSARVSTLERLGRLALGENEIASELKDASGIHQHLYSKEHVNHLKERAANLLEGQDDYLSNSLSDRKKVKFGTSVLNLGELSAGDFVWLTSSEWDRAKVGVFLGTRGGGNSVPSLEFTTLDINSAVLTKLSMPVDKIYLSTAETFGRPFVVEKMRVSSDSDTAIVQKLSNEIKAKSVNEQTLKNFGAIKSPILVRTDIKIESVDMLKTMTK